jgi:hypothetical protein
MTINDVYDKIGDNFEAFDTKLWIHSHVGDGWFPTWNSWHKVQAWRMKEDLFKEAEDVAVIELPTD